MYLGRQVESFLRVARFGLVLKQSRGSRDPGDLQIEKKSSRLPSTVHPFFDL